MKVKLDVKYLTKKIHGDQNAMVCVSCDLMRSVCEPSSDCDHGGCCFDNGACAMGL